MGGVGQWWFKVIARGNWVNCWGQKKKIEKKERTTEKSSLSQKPKS